MIAGTMIFDGPLPHCENHYTVQSATSPFRLGHYGYAHAAVRATTQRQARPGLGKARRPQVDLLHELWVWVQCAGPICGKGHLVAPGLQGS